MMDSLDRKRKVAALFIPRAIEPLKAYRTVFSTCIKITRNNFYCFILKNVENCKHEFQRVKELQEI